MGDLGHHWAERPSRAFLQCPPADGFVADAVLEAEGADGAKAQLVVSVKSGPAAIAATKVCHGNLARGR